MPAVLTTYAYEVRDALAHHYGKTFAQARRIVTDNLDVVEQWEADGDIHPEHAARRLAKVSH